MFEADFGSNPAITGHTPNFLIDGACSARLADAKNNYEVFNLVKHVSSLLHVPSEDREFDLAKLIQDAYALELTRPVGREGLGHLYALTFWDKGRPIRGILTNVSPEVLPAKSLTMMHAGIGLGFAQQLMNTVNAYSEPDEIRSVLREFVTLVDETRGPVMKERPTSRWV